jgi:hypothetical protein
MLWFRCPLVSLLRFLRVTASSLRAFNFWFQRRKRTAVSRVVGDCYTTKPSGYSLVALKDVSYREGVTSVVLEAWLESSFSHQDFPKRIFKDIQRGVGLD